MFGHLEDASMRCYIEIESVLCVVCSRRQQPLNLVAYSQALERYHPLHSTYYYIVVLYSSGQVGKWSQWLRSNNIVLVATALLRQRDRPLVSYRDGHFRLMHRN